MQAKIAISALALVALFAAGCAQTTGQAANNDGIQAPPVDDGGNGGAMEPQTHMITITDDGYSPQQITVKQGDTVRWVNEGATLDWPASAQHPTHTTYPGSGIEKCGTSEAQNIFDACHALENGDSYSFTFTERGTWAYHDHVAAKMFGRIVVE